MKTETKKLNEKFEALKARRANIAKLLAAAAREMAEVEAEILDMDKDIEAAINAAEKAEDNDLVADLEENAPNLLEDEGMDAEDLEDLAKEAEKLA